MKAVEYRYMQRKSARSFMVWLFRLTTADTPAAGKILIARLFGMTVTLYLKAILKA